MVGLEAMIIPYIGLANGEYSYAFKLDNAFFKHFEKSKIKQAAFDVDITVEKRDRMIVLMITSSGALHAGCDRCLKMIDVPVSYEDRLILKVEDEPQGHDDEVYYLDPKTSHIDLSTYIHESIHLHLPISNLRNCEEEGYIYCDQKVLDTLDGIEEQPPPTSDTENPWNSLKDLDLDH